MQSIKELIQNKITNRRKREVSDLKKVFVHFVVFGFKGEIWNNR